MNEVLRLPCLAALFAAVACGATGPLCLARRGTYVAGAVSHACFAGLGLAQWLCVVHGVSWATPTVGALAAAVAAALFLALRPGASGGNADAALSAVWAVGMAVGLAFLCATPGYRGDLSGYLFGSILFVSPSDIRDMAALDIALLAVLPLFWRGILAVSFGAAAARIRGAPARLYESVIFVSVALAVVVLVRATGIVLAVALLSLPALGARVFSRSLPGRMVAAGVLAFASLGVGLAVSWKCDIPPSAPTVFAAAALAVICRAIGAAAIRLRSSAVAARDSSSVPE